jgi:hypothetical protein
MDEEMLNELEGLRLERKLLALRVKELELYAVKLEQMLDKWTAFLEKLKGERDAALQLVKAT